MMVTMVMMTSKASKCFIRVCCKKARSEINAPPERCQIIKYDDAIKVETDILKPLTDWQR